MVEGNNNKDILLTDNLLPNKKVRWKDIAESNSAAEKDEKIKSVTLEKKLTFN